MPNLCGKMLNVYISRIRGGEGPIFESEIVYYIVNNALLKKTKNQIFNYNWNFFG